MGALSLAPLGPSNAVAANGLTLKPNQERFLQPVSYQEAAETVNPSAAWQQVVLDGDRVVGFVIGHFDADEEREEFRSCLWQINVDAGEQGRGVGRFAAEALAGEAKRRGFEQLTVLWESGEAGPEAFFLRLGFVPVGETAFGDVIGALRLDD